MTQPCCTIATTAHMLAYQCDGQAVLTTECHELITHLGSLDASWDGAPEQIEGGVAGVLGCDPDLLLATRTYGGWRINWAPEPLVTHRRRRGARVEQQPPTVWDWWFSRPEAREEEPWCTRGNEGGETDA